MRPARRSKRNAASNSFSGLAAQQFVSANVYAMVPWIRDAAASVDEHIKDGRFQRSLALVTAASSFISGLEVSYEHYKGSYSNLIMYSPVVLSGVVTAAGISGFFSRRAAQGFLRWSSAVTLADGVTGFYFHIRGIQRKPGGWRLPLTNVIMGPPIFAPLLFGTAAYLGLMASYLRREEDSKLGLRLIGNRAAKTTQAGGVN